MKANETSLLNLLQNAKQFAIPLYQRSYSWTTTECSQLWRDLVSAGRDDHLDAHFVGTVVYIEKDQYQIAHHNAVLVIDGQQRLTTAMLLLEALARHVGDQEPLDGFSGRKIRHYYLLNPLESGERQFKLLPTETDDAHFRALMVQAVVPEAQKSLRIDENFRYFVDQLGTYADEIAVICRGLSKLMVVAIALNRAHDNPQRIFESLNSTGRRLTQTDLIRNFVLMDHPPDRQDDLYRRYWRPMELAFGQKDYATEFDRFVRDYLTAKTGDLPNLADIYAAFKRFAVRQSSAIAPRPEESWLAELRRFAEHYAVIALGAETDPDIRAALDAFRQLDVRVANPLLLVMYDDYRGNHLNKNEFLQALRWIESAIFRRMVCGLSSQGLNKFFATLPRSLDKTVYLPSLAAHLRQPTSSLRFPDDDEFLRELKVRNLYQSGFCGYLLERLENADRRERVAVNTLSTEHLMPQTLTEAWRAALGDEAQRLHEQYLHTLGNLTLTAYNAHFSNRPFVEKRDLPDNGLRFSPLKLNAGLGQLQVWNEATLRERADRLARQAAEIWPYPTLPDGVALPKKAKSAPVRREYDLSHYKALQPGRPVNALFQTLRGHLLALDPQVSETVLKHYIAYKWRTGFVEVAPQSRQLKVWLRLSFDEIHDPDGFCKDVSAVGHYGNGDMEIVIGTAADLERALPLIRQAFEKQRHGNDAAP